MLPSYFIYFFFLCDVHCAYVGGICIHARDVVSTFNNMRDILRRCNVNQETKHKIARLLYPTIKQYHV